MPEFSINQMQPENSDAGMREHIRKIPILVIANLAFIFTSLVSDKLNYTNKKDQPTSSRRELIKNVKERIFQSFHFRKPNL